MTDEGPGDGWEDYQSGPFCRHWSDPADCEERCGRCGHGCTRHDFGDGKSDCLEDGCGCEAWLEESGVSTA